jgi:hypothetical protein
VGFGTVDACVTRQNGSLSRPIGSTTGLPMRASRAKGSKVVKRSEVGWANHRHEPYSGSNAVAVEI